MKTTFTLNRKRALKTFGFFMSLLLTFMAWNPLHGQTSKVTSAEVAQEGRIIKGLISNADGPLESASIVLKGTSTGTTSNAKGEFTFPKLLNTGDVLLITYLGFEAQEVKIKDTTTFLNLQMSEELIEFSGALNADTPYKSKRSKN